MRGRRATNEMVSGVRTSGLTEREGRRVAAVEVRFVVVRGTEGKAF
jgi:hypothetical protein